VRWVDPAALWGALFLGEAVTIAMDFGGKVMLRGTALAIGVLRWSMQQAVRRGQPLSRTLAACARDPQPADA
jgi:hypothetical protein